MKLAYVDAFSGVSGDMFLASLLDAGVPLEEMQAMLDQLRLPERVQVRVEETRKGALRAALVTVDAPESHHHRHLSDIQAMITASGLPDAVQDASLKVFQVLAEAEARVHGTSVEHVHFHEVGALDSIADVVGAAIGLHLLGIERLYASALPYGSGQVMTEHGALPLPAPATLEILSRAHVPLTPSPAHFEQVTPTGAALLAALATFERPDMLLERIGVGAGRKDFAWPNVLRLWLGRSPADQDFPMVVLETNIDDMNPQLYGMVMAKLFEAGARDVFFTPIYMKKNRPATMLSIIARRSEEAALARIVMEQTSTLGLRVQPVYRLEAEREFHQVDTSYGAVPVKVKILDGRKFHAQPEFDACARIAQEHNVPVAEVYTAALLAGRSLLI
ncbi:MAG: nickel pincer cofactor biosynthesis protein LarC [Anaerolineae bacterium]|nr:nickel pincer cofactor biosynthesis protein LarC [Anaerolineae bacterium]